MNSKVVVGFVAGALATATVTAILVGGDADADRVDTWQSATARATSVQLVLTEDGGCQATAHGEARKADGGTLHSVATQELSGAAQTRCLNILDDAKALWKAREGL